MVSVLFICTHNAARSQMAEALADRFYGDLLQASSAGTEPGVLNPDAVQAMRELGIDISGQVPKSITSFKGRRFDIVVTLCEDAAEACPCFPGDVVLHHAFPDPSRSKDGSATARLARDMILRYIEEELAPIAVRSGHERKERNVLPRALHSRP